MGITTDYPEDFVGRRSGLRSTKGSAQHQGQVTILPEDFVGERSQLRPTQVVYLRSCLLPEDFVNERSVQRSTKCGDRFQTDAIFGNSGAIMIINFISICKDSAFSALSL